MANIENRRKKRKLMRIAVPIGAALLLCAVILLAVLLPKSCANKNNSDIPAGPTQQALETEAPASEPPAQTPLSTEDSKPSPKPTEQAHDASEPVSPDELHQITVERSIAYYVVKCGSFLNSSGERMELVSGTMTMQFVNNTGAELYAAYLELPGLGVSSAAIGGAAVRFYSDDAGRCVLPFSNGLEPGGSLTLFIEFTGSVVERDGLTLPRIAYDTVYDAVCFVTTDTELEFSGGEVSNEPDGDLLRYRCEAEGTRQLTVIFKPFEQ